MKKAAIFFKLFLLMNCYIVVGQVQEYVLNPASSKLIIKGTSSLHDWNMNAENPTCVSLMEIENSIVKKIDQVNFSCKVEKIVSNESSIMDGKAHDALKSKNYPLITFKFSAVKEIRNTSVNHFEGKIIGTLSMAGKSRPVSIPFSGTVENKKVVISGSYPLKMSDYDITPPTAMLGALKTGDNIVLDYAFEFAPSSKPVKVSVK